MKKGKLLLIISTLAVSVLLFTTSFAAVSSSTQNNGVENAIKNYQLNNTSQDDVKELKVLENDKVKTIKVKYLIPKVSDNKVKSAYYYANQACQEEMNFDNNGHQIGTYNYTLATDEEIFFYEQTESNPNEAEMLIYTLSDEEKEKLAADLNAAETAFQNSSSSYSLSATGTPISISDGFGGKAVIANTTNKYLNTAVSLPTTSELVIPTNYTPYIYGGFMGGQSASYGTINSDIGLQYSTTYQVWKPFININANTYKGKALSGFDQVMMQNGFLPSTSITRRTVTLTIHPKNDQAYGLAGSVRLKAEGLAKYATSGGTGGNTNLTAILEGATSDQASGTVIAFNISSVSSHKVVCTLAAPAGQDDGTTTAGKNWCKFSSLNIYGTTITTSQMTLQQEHATFPTFSNGIVEINVDKPTGII